MKFPITPALYLFVTVFFLLWIPLSGHYTPLLLALGVASAVGVVLLCWRMRILDRDIAPLHVTWGAVRYVPWLLWEMIWSSLDVMYRVLHPRLPIEPQTFRITATQTTDLGRVTFADSITLHPGTLTIDAVDDHFTIHAIADKPAAELKDGGMDRRITSLEPGS